MRGCAAGRRHGIHSAGVPGVAAGHPPDGQPGSSPKTMHPIGFSAITGTAGMKPAGAGQQGRQHASVNLDQKIWHTPHSVPMVPRLEQEKQEAGFSADIGAQHRFGRFFTKTSGFVGRGPIETVYVESVMKTRGGGYGSAAGHWLSRLFSSSVTARAFTSRMRCRATRTTHRPVSASCRGFPPSFPEKYLFFSQVSPVSTVPEGWLSKPTRAPDFRVSRKATRNNRLARFLWTAPPTFRLATTAEAWSAAGNR